MSDFAINVKVGTREIAPATPTMPAASGGSGGFTYAAIGAPAWLSFNAQRQVSVNADVPANTRPLLSFLWRATDQNGLTVYEVIHVYVQKDGDGEFVPLQSGQQNNIRGVAWSTSGERLQYWNGNAWTNAPNYLTADNDAAITADWLFNRGTNVAPFRVGGTAKVNDLNADKVDGRDVGTGTSDLLIKSDILNLTTDWAKAGNAALIPDAKLTGVVDDVTESAGVLTITYKGGQTSQITLPTGISESEAQGLIIDWAETGNVTRIPKAKLPLDLVDSITFRGGTSPELRVRNLSGGTTNIALPTGGSSGGLSQSQVQGLIADWAETGNVTLIPAAKLPNDVVVGVTEANGVITVTPNSGTATLITLPAGGTGGGLTDAQVKALIEDWAEVGRNVIIPLAKIPTAIARVSQIPTVPEVGSLVESVSESMGVLTITKQDGSTNLITLPAGDGGGLSQSQVQGLIADWAETGNLTLIPSAKLPSIGSAGNHTHSTTQTSLSDTTDAATGTSAAAVGHEHTVGNATAGGTVGSGGSGNTGGVSQIGSAPLSSNHQHSIPAHSHPFTGTAHGHTTGTAGGHSHAFGSHSHGFSYNHSHNTTGGGSHLHSF